MCLSNKLHRKLNNSLDFHGNNDFALKVRNTTCIKTQLIKPVIYRLSLENMKPYYTLCDVSSYYTWSCLY